MTRWTLARRSLLHHWRSHVGVLLGAVVGSAVLVGALVVGDSIQATLRQMAVWRLGQVELAMPTGDRFFRAELAGEVAQGLADRAPGAVRPPAAAALLVSGSARILNSPLRANQVQVLGVDAAFWALAPRPYQPPPTQEPGVILSDRLAAQLQVGVGDTVQLRIEKPSLLSRDAALASTHEEESVVPLSVPVAGIVGPEHFARFSLRSEPTPPMLAFLPLARLQALIDLPGKANLLLLGPGADLDAAQAVLRQRWQLADAALELRPVPDLGMLELRSTRVFLEPAVVQAARQAMPRPLGVLTYLVNLMRRGDAGPHPADTQPDRRTPSGRLGDNAEYRGLTPYSMVTALGPLTAADEPGDAPPATQPVGAARVDLERLPPDTIVTSQWLADDLDIATAEAQPLELRYFVLGGPDRLKEVSHRLPVVGIVPMSGLAADRELMPLFPDTPKSNSMAAWKPSFDLRYKIRRKDDDYWKQHRGTPKAFVSLETGRKLWGNRFGDLTAVRCPADAAPPAQVEARLRQALDPASVGLSFLPVRASAFSVQQANDFGMLFLGFSFFLIVAALLLVGLLFSFGVDQRKGEIGTLLAVGLPPGFVRTALLAEGTLLAAAGSVLGAGLGLLYTRAVLLGLRGAWSGAIGGLAVVFDTRPATLALGAAASTAIAALTIWLAIRRQARQPARVLLSKDPLSGGAGAAPATGALRPGRGVSGLLRPPRLALLLAGVCLLLAAGLLLAMGRAEGQARAGAFFGAGSALLVALLALAAAGIAALARRRGTDRLSLAGVGLRGSARRRGRSLATISLLACGSFLIVAVAAFRHDALEGLDRRDSGTGGFAFLGRTSLPVIHDPLAPEGFKLTGLPAGALDHLDLVMLRVRPGDDASCLNLGRPQAPALWGVDPRALARRNAFTFTQTIPSTADNPWLLLDAPTEPGVLNAIGDATTLQWSLKVGVGQTLDYQDDTGGRFKLRIVAALSRSMLQGGLLISESQFTRRFPTESGYRMFLVGGPSPRLAALGSHLADAWAGQDLELTPAARRLADLNAVENTYLAIFQALGGLGLVLGSAGLGVVVLRNVLERRGELAVMRAMGLSRNALRWLVLSEHLFLLAAGLLTGVLAAILAAGPALLAPGSQVSYGSLALTLAIVFLSGLLWVSLASLAALGGPLLAALRDE